MARTKQTVHKTTGGEASIRQSATRDEATQGLPETEPPRKRIARGFCTLCKGSSYPQQVVGFTQHPGVAAIANAVPSVAGGAEGGTVPSAVGGAEGGAIASAAMGAIDLTQQQQQEEEEEAEEREEMAHVMLTSQMQAQLQAVYPHLVWVNK